MYIIHRCKCVLQVILPETLKGRVYHTSVVIHSSPKIGIICFGGADDWPEEPLLITQTTMVELCKHIYNLNTTISSQSNTVGRVLKCEYLLIANCEFFDLSQLIDSQT